MENSQKVSKFTKTDWIFLIVSPIIALFFGLGTLFADSGNTLIAGVVTTVAAIWLFVSKIKKYNGTKSQSNNVR